MTQPTSWIWIDFVSGSKNYAIVRPGDKEENNSKRFLDKIAGINEPSGGHVFSLALRFVIPGHFNSRVLFHRSRIRILLRSRYFNPVRRRRKGKRAFRAAIFLFDQLRNSCLVSWDSRATATHPIDIRFIRGRVTFAEVSAGIYGQLTTFRCLSW